MIVNARARRCAHPCHVAPSFNRHGRACPLGIDVGHCSASLTTALAGIWSAASKGGTNIAASQALSGCTGGATNFSLALAPGAGNTDLTSAKLYFNVGTSQASPTVDVTIWILDKSIN